MVKRPESRILEMNEFSLQKGFKHSNVCSHRRLHYTLRPTHSLCTQVHQGPIPQNDVCMTCSAPPLIFFRMLVAISVIDRKESATPSIPIGNGGGIEQWTANNCGHDMRNKSYHAPAFGQSAIKSMPMHAFNMCVERTAI